MSSLNLFIYLRILLNIYISQFNRVHSKATQRLHHLDRQENDTTELSLQQNLFDHDQIIMNQ